MSAEKPLQSEDVVKLVNSVPTESGALYMPSAPIAKPLHVRVSEALGWKAFRPDGPDELRAVEPDYHQVERVPRFDTDWSATGPLIEARQYDLRHHHPRFSRKAFLWEATWWNLETEQDMSMNGETPLIAVCNLILALKEAGKL